MALMEKEEKVPSSCGWGQHGAAHIVPMCWRNLSEAAACGKGHGPVQRKSLPHCLQLSSVFREVEALCS